MTLEVKDRHMYETTWVPVIVLTFHKRRESTNLQNEAPENRVTFSDARHFECGTLSGYGFIYLSSLWGWEPLSDLDLNVVSTESE